MSSQKSSMPAEAQGRLALLLGGIAAILASTCCVGPLVLLMLGFSGAWIGNLTVLQAYQPLFMATAVIALFFAWRRIWRPAEPCQPGAVCALPQPNQAYRWMFVLVVMLVSLALAFPAIAPFFY